MQTNNPSVALDTIFLSPPILATVSSQVNQAFLHITLERLLKAKAYHPHKRLLEAKVYHPTLKCLLEAKAYHPTLKHPLEAKVYPTLKCLLEAKVSHPSLKHLLEVKACPTLKCLLEAKAYHPSLLYSVSSKGILQQVLRIMLQSHREPSGLCIPCTKAGCNRWFRNRSGHTQHMNMKHPIFLMPPAPISITTSVHQALGLAPWTSGDASPMDDEDPPQLRAEFSDIKWQSFSAKYTGAIPDEGALPWMEDSHEVWFHDPCDVVRNMLANPDFAAEMDLQPYCEFATENDEHQWKDFMSGDWSWAQADKISEDPDTHGSTFVPVILGSDKTTISVATGQNDYYPLYASIGNIQNNVHRAHRNGVVVIGFLAMPKTTKEHAETPSFQNFQRQLFHSSLSFILKNLKPAMMKPEVTCFGDGHYRRVIYGLGPYIADYEEQVLLTCIFRNWCTKCLSRHGNLNDVSLCRSRSHTDVLIEECNSGTLHLEYGIVGELVPFTNDFPHADIHELLAPDILHQLIKGGIQRSFGRLGREMTLTEVPPFPGLRRFPQGHHFKQWTGDDSKALVKVYLPAIEGYVPVDVVRSFQALLEFCYLVHRNVISEKSLSEIKDALTRNTLWFTIPALFDCLVPQMGCAPRSLESKHIKAVKEPWRRSGRYKALGQMLLTNQHLDKLAASQVDFHFRGMLAEPSADGRPATISSARTDAEEPHTADLDQQEPSIPKSASVADADVATDFEDIDAPMSVLAHVKLAQTSPDHSVKTPCKMGSPVGKKQCRMGTGRSFFRPVGMTEATECTNCSGQA
ncbi:hypothetical protein EV424DRAFT_1544679 [Suillus variegatus]|nr:hypothetical protein EV424DRAFT_1544679 [Suillus variegatus]